MALTTVGNVVARLVRGDRWDGAVFDGTGTPVVGSSSSGEPAIGALADEFRRLRLTGAALPSIGASLVAPDRRSLVAACGRQALSTVVFRIFRAPGSRRFEPGDTVAAEQLLDRFGGRIVADVDGSSAVTNLVADRTAPIVFGVDAAGTLTRTVEDPPDATAAPLLAAFTPHADRVPAVLQPFVEELLARHARGARGADLVAIMPFALVRLLPVSGHREREFLVRLEWLRRPASLLTTATRYEISRRELQLLEVILRGESVAAVAAELHIAESTVVFHLKRMLRKTAARNRIELVARLLGFEARESL